jgi:predicted nucleic acid-binding protein
MGVTRAPAAVADTSLFIAAEGGRILRDVPPHDVAVSIITVAELRAGVLSATDDAARSRRLATLRSAERLEALLIDDGVASAWADLRLALRKQSRRMPVNDSWIAATALAHGIPVVAQDDDFEDVPGLAVIRV